jgi:hypothetical protein
MMGRTHAGTCQHASLCRFACAVFTADMSALLLLDEICAFRHACMCQPIAQLQTISVLSRTHARTCRRSSWCRAGRCLPRRHLRTSAAHPLCAARGGGTAAPRSALAPAARLYTYVTVQSLMFRERGSYHQGTQIQQHPATAT